MYNRTNKIIMDLLKKSKSALQEFNKLVGEKLNFFPNIMHFYQLTGTTPLQVSAELSQKVIDKELLANWLLLLENINLVFNNRMLNTSTTFLQPKLVEIYKAEYKELKEQLKNALGYTTENSKYNITIKFE